MARWQSSPTPPNRFTANACEQRTWVHVDVANQVVPVHVDDVSVEAPVDVSAYSAAPVDEDLPQAAIALASMDATWPA